MPKCLDCGNTQKFWYEETNTCLGEYHEDGSLADVIYNEYSDVRNGYCDACESKNIEGEL